MLIKDKPDLGKVSYDDKRRLVLYEWKTFAAQLPDMKDMLTAADKTIASKKCQVVITDTSRVTTVLYPDVVQYFGTVTLPSFEKLGVRLIVTVVPSSALAKISTTNWQASSFGKIGLLNVKTLEEGYEVARKFLGGENWAPSANAP